MKNLTKKQLTTLLIETRNWEKKQRHVLGIIRSMGFSLAVEELSYFIDVFIPQQQKRAEKEEKQQQQEYFRKCQTGEINGKYTPTRVDGTFKAAGVPQIGKTYHLSWAFKAARFRLVRKDPDGIHGYVDNPVHKRPEPMKILLADLYEKRKR